MLSGIAPLFAASTIRVPSHRAAPSATAGATATEALERSTARTIAELRSAIVHLREVLARGTILTGRPQDTAIESAMALGLGATPSPARLVSTEEVNTIPTSFTPRGPVFSGLSDALPTIGGIYAGATDDVLTFEAQDATTVGGNKDINFQVRNGQGQLLETFLVPSNSPAGTVIGLANGLEFSLGAGQVKKNDAFTVEVFASVGSSVDPTKPFDGTRNDHPGFEDGLAVQPGSFTVNGVTITVGASDTLNDVLARITASAADVTATFDAATETVTLVHKTPGPGGVIDLASDTSGFLAATKLAGATLTPGTETDAARPLAEVAALTGIVAGTITVAGVTLAVDPSADSLEAVLDRITASAAGVTATLENDRVRLRANGPGRPFVLDEGGTRLFTTLAIATGSHGAPAIDRATTFTRAAEGGRAVERLTTALDELFRLDALSRAAGGATFVGDALRAGILTAVTSTRPGVATSGPRVETGLGIELLIEESGAGRIRLDRAAFERALVTDPESALAFLLRDEVNHDRDGLLAGLDHAADHLLDALRGTSGTTGLIVNVTA